MSTNQAPEVAYAAQVSLTTFFSLPACIRGSEWSVMQDTSQKPPPM